MNGSFVLLSAGGQRVPEKNDSSNDHIDISLAQYEGSISRSRIRTRSSKGYIRYVLLRYLMLRNVSLSYVTSLEIM